MAKPCALWFAGIAAVALCASEARAQAPAPVPEAMPYDIPYGPPIDLDTAQKAIQAAQAEAKKHNWKMAISARPHKSAARNNRPTLQQSSFC